MVEQFRVACIVPKLLWAFLFFVNIDCRELQVTWYDFESSVQFCIADVTN